MKFQYLKKFELHIVTIEVKCKMGDGTFWEETLKRRGVNLLQRDQLNMVNFKT